MAINLHKLITYLDQYLNAQSIQDYCPNGLQIEGKQAVGKILGGVTATQELIDFAISQHVDAILVHHGFFWKGENQAITGIKKNRIQALLQHDISLIAYHLPLDVHPVIGNNIQLAKLLGLKNIGPLEPQSKSSIGITGELDEPVSAALFNKIISSALGRDCVQIGDASKLLKTVGLCTGAAQGMINQAVSLGVDAFISGEISEPTVHIANETGVNYFSAGHHATERGGVIALGNHLADKFDVEFEFIDLFHSV